jgi:hypothetical protein
MKKKKKKLALEPDQLTVDSFETVRPAEARGTVLAQGTGTHCGTTGTDTEWVSVCDMCIPPSEAVTQCGCSFDGEVCA